MADNNWTKLTVKSDIKYLDDICAVMCMLDNGLMIEDYSDVTVNGMYGDLIDESILNADKSRVSVSLFVPEEKNLAEYTSFITERFCTLGIEAETVLEGVSEQDWAESWKKYYKPIKLGKITIVPAWEKYEAQDGEIILRMDPGMAFGTGTHETTRLVIELMQEMLTGNERVLDVGTGSGILAICASKLGAKSCAAYDIDPVAVRVARDNIASDGATNVTCDVSDLLASVDLSGGPYDVVLANIVADIIIRMLPDVHPYLAKNGKMILSGIIAPRADEIRENLSKNNFRIVCEKQENDWLAIMVEHA